MRSEKNTEDILIQTKKMKGNEMDENSIKSNNPGCLEYAIIIALIIPITIVLLVANKLGLISEEQLKKLNKQFNPNTEDEE